MEINFCKQCDNLLFIYSDEEDASKLYLGCKACGFKEEYTEDKCVYNNEYKVNLSETINQNKFLHHDITLPSITGNTNIKCPNKECESITGNKPSDVIYIKFNADAMKYLYGCKYCKQKWTNQ
jgi:DNA-directed RNA polymerase subunit M/transcription elongation factor TFIIS